MTPPNPPNPEDSLAPDPRDERIGALINEFFDRRQNGENLSEEDFVAEHPDDAQELRAHLTGLDLLQGLGGASSDATQVVVRHAGDPGSSSRSAETPKSANLPVIPGYQMMREIGRGGMGIVFKAVQVSTKRVVALKLLLEGPLATESARRRFEREIALAAQLRHPSIIPIYDSGSAEGRMYYAMEHIFGMPLNAYVRTHNLSVTDRVRLFVKVCEPISHAHMRGVIHRDLKPSNVLVDGNGEPHVLDFGLARSGSVVDAATSISMQIVGTLAYMSPEQASGDPTGVDTRTDVYSLGVILYEMVTGRMPYDTSLALGKVLNNIAHAEPVAPQRVRPDKEAARGDGSALRVDADLSAIILKALEKRKEDRYQSVDALTGDLRRYLAGEPITAKPASSWYLLRKIAWKHRLAVGISAAAIFLTVGMIGIVGHFSRKLEKKAAELEEKAIAVDQSQQELQRKQAEIDRYAQEQESARQAYALLKQNLSPDVQKQFDALISAGGSSARPEQLIAKLLQDAVASQIEPAPPMPGTSSIKESPVDPNALQVSRRPDWVAPPPAPLASGSDQALVNQLNEVLRALISPPTTQPATTQPATSRPVATGDSTRRADDGAEADRRKAVTPPKPPLQSPSVPAPPS